LYQKNHLTGGEGDDVSAGNDAWASCFKLGLDGINQVLTVDC
jgi:hypothetical protein